MLGMTDEDERVLAQRDDFKLVVAARIGDEAQIHDVAGHVFVHLVGAAVFDVDGDRGIALQELFQVRRQIVQADAVNGRYADGAGDNVFDFLKLALEGLVGADDLLAVFIENLALARQAELLLAALDQQRFEKALERTDLLADGRLGDIVDLSRLGEALGIGQIEKNFEAVNLHKKLKYETWTKTSTNRFGFRDWRVHQIGRAHV